MQKQVIVSITLIALISCSGYMDEAPAFEYFQPLPDQPLVPTNNPLTSDKIALGQQLFFDTRLSSQNRLSCNNCHNLLTGGDDDLAFSVNEAGLATKRSAPGLWNIGLQTVLNWDGRAKTLEAQAKEHLLDKSIMAFNNHNELIRRIQADDQYRKLFELSFPGTGVSIDSIAKALASFQRSLMSPNSPFDQYMRGNKNAMSQLAISGMDKFNERGCSACHFGVNFAGPAPGPAMTIGDGFYELFPNTRGTVYEKSHKLLEDKGRYYFTKIESDIYMWRVPPLRNIALTAPYFHNGSAKTLREAVKIMGKTQFNFDLTEQDIDEITAFLNSLTGQTPAVLLQK